MEKKFKTNDEFMANLLAAVQSPKIIYAYEGGGEHGSVEENETYNIYWLGDDFTVSGLSITLLSLFGENLVLKIEHNLDNPFELEDGTKMYEKYLTVTGWWNDRIGCKWDGYIFDIKDANEED